MNSINIKHIPLNREGANELGINPCDVCNVGWACYDGKEIKSCYNSCSYFLKKDEEGELKQLYASR